MSPSDPPSGYIANKAHHFPLRVYFEDTDLTGVVYHANYLRYCERARSDAMRALGLDHRGAFEAGQGYFAVVNLTIRYRAPARLDDALVIISQITILRAASWLVHQRVMRGAQLLADADVHVAFLDAKGRPTRQPADWSAAYRQILKDD